MTYDLGFLAYADAVPLPDGDRRYCLICQEVFRPRRQDQIYCGTACKRLSTVRTMRARKVHPVKRGRPRKALNVSPLAWQAVLGRATP